MNWKDIGGIVASAAPVLGTLLGGPAGGAVGGIIASVLGSEAKPDAVAAAIQADPDAMVKLRQIEADHEADLQRMVLEAETTRLGEVNATMRAEVASSDGYVRRARPTFMYVIAASVLIEVIIAGMVVLVAPEQIGQLATLYSALATPQGIAAAMCGVYIKARSDDKAVAAGEAPGGLWNALASRLSK